MKKAIIGKGITSIPEFGFRACDSLTSITFRGDITSIENGAFWSCGFTSFKVPDSVVSISKQAFIGCTNLTSVDLGSKITTINNHLFDSCTELKSVKIPNTVKSIGKGAFRWCDKIDNGNVFFGK